MSVIETKRLVLRRFCDIDWKDLYEYLSDEQVIKYEPYGTYTEEECKQEAIKRSVNPAFWAVVLKDSQKLIGNIYFESKEFDTWEIGYVFNKAFQGFGYATEGSLAVMEHAFQNLNARRIMARCNIENSASWKLMERLKMRREGLFLKVAYFKKDVHNNPIWIDALEYAVLKDEWL